MNNPSFRKGQKRSATIAGRSEPLTATRTPTLKVAAAATAVALALLPDANAQVIGDIDVRSSIGEKFFAAVPVQSARALDPNCIQVGRNPSAPEGAQSLSGTRVRINPTGAVESVIIETAGTVASQVVGLRLQVGCVNPVVRDFVVRTDTAPVVAEAPPQPVAAAPSRPRQRARAQAPRATSAAPRVAAAAPQPAAAQPRTPAPAPQAQAAPREDLIPKAPVVTAHSIPMPGTLAAGTSAPAAPASVADQEAQKRIAELRARSDDHAASLLALEDRLGLLQKHAELLKAQLEKSLVISTQSGAAAAPAAVEPIATAASTAAVTQTSEVAIQAQAPSQARTLGDLVGDWRVIGGALGGLLLAAMGYGAGRRRTVVEPERPAAPAMASLKQPVARAPRPAAGLDRTQELPAARATPEAERTAQWPAAPTPIADETAQWEVRPPTTTTMPVPEGVPQSAIVTQPGIGITRDFHITQQFQPTNERAVALSTPEELVQQARTHYMDDGDTFRAIDLLEMAVSVRTDSTRPWQALFAIYRRENMTERYQRLAVAYRQAFGEDEHWPTIQGLGLEIDAANPLYAGAAGAQPVAADVLERWLGVPLDFTAHLLANEMHDQLMETFPGRGKKRKRVSGE